MFYIPLHVEAPTHPTLLEYHSSFTAQLNITPITKTEENFQSFLVVFVI